MFKYIAFKIIHRIAMALPMSWCYWLGCRVAGINYILKKDLRQAVKSNIAHILSQASRGKIKNSDLAKYTKETFKNFAKYLVDFFSFSKLNEKSIHDLVKIHNEEHMRNAFKKGKGVIGLSAHLGNWELCAVATALLGFKVHIIAMSHENTKINRLFVNQRAAQGIKVIPVGSGAGVYINVLKHNDLIALAGDRLINDSGIKVSFFNKPSVIPKGPILLSMRTGALIVMGSMIRNKDDKFDLYYEEAIDPDFFSGTYSEKIQKMADKITAMMEKYISKYPEQWFLFHRVWEN